MSEQNASRPPRRLLITGGAGFIGANFVRHRVSARPRDALVVLDALTYAGNRATIEPLIESHAISFVHGEVGNESLVKAVLGEHAIDTIVHFAAESHVDRSIAEPGAFVRTNVLGTQVLLDAARHAWQLDGEWRRGVRFHHISTDEVYGALSPTDPLSSERSPYCPNSPYAASKAGSDHLVRSYINTYGLPATISTCSNNFGPYQFPEKLVPLMIVNALLGRSLPIYGDGHQVRDWLFVDDHCRAIDLILESDVAGETYNVGARAEVTNLNVVRRICAEIDARIANDLTLAQQFPDCPAARGASCSMLITHVTDRPGHDRRYAIDTTKISTTLGFKPEVTLEKGLRRTVDWYLANEPWWRAVLSGSYRQWIETNYAGRLELA